MSSPPLTPDAPTLARTESKLGFGAIAEALAAACRSTAGRRRALALPWLATHDEVARALAQVEEAGRLTEAGLALPQGAPHDVDGLFAQLAKDAALSGGELIMLAQVAAAIAQARDFAAREATVWPALAALCAGEGASTHGVAELSRLLGSALAQDGSLRDEASPALAALRAQVRSLEARLRATMEDALRDPEVAPHLQDDFVSLRNGRYVLPVVASFQSKVPGIVHNASQTGQTLFVEPLSIVPMGNQLVVARARVDEEEARLLHLLSREVAAQAPALVAGVADLARLDVVLATSELSRRHGWQAPRLAAPTATPVLHQLRHPELELRGRPVVANDVAFAPGQQALVLSGPNAGGKTVALRAFGLCVRMVRAGMPVPLGKGSVLPLYVGLFADVGDAQDLAAGTSSFSAHLRALRQATLAAAPGVLVLLDEVGKDTDPSEGTALARAVLEVLLEAGAFVVATTHLEGIKALAHLDARFVNARIELEPQSLRPTHKLVFGAAGRSYAFAVARQVGMAEAVIARAQHHLQGGEGQLAQALADLEGQQAVLVATRAALAEEREDVQRLRAELRARGEAEARQAEGQRRAAERELARQLDGAAAQLGRHLAALERPGARAEEAERQRADWHRQAARARTAAGPERAPATAGEQDAAGPALAAAGSPVVVGGPVWITTLARAGEVVALHGSQATVALGSMRTRVALSALRPLKRSRSGAATERGGTRLVTHAPQAPAVAAGRCDLRGLRVDEAERVLVAALDACLSEGSATLWVVHGLGSGAMRAYVRETLAASPYVADFRPGDTHEGGEGVTVVSFDVGS